MGTGDIDTVACWAFRSLPLEDFAGALLSNRGDILWKLEDHAASFRTSTTLSIVPLTLANLFLPVVTALEEHVQDIKEAGGRDNIDKKLEREDGAPCDEAELWLDFGRDHLEPDQHDICEQDLGDEVADIAETAPDWAAHSLNPPRFPTGYPQASQATKTIHLAAFFAILAAIASNAGLVVAKNFPSLDEAFAAISRDGVQNPGLDADIPSLTSGSRRSRRFSVLLEHLPPFRLHELWGKTYRAHFYCLYFLKDKALDGNDLAGHRHDIEHVTIWTNDGVVTHAGRSAHGDVENEAIDGLDQQDGHVKIDGEKAKNSYGKFVTPPIVDWFYMVGDGLDNEAMKEKLNGFDFGSAHVPILDGDFISNVNDAKPDGYPTWESSA
ncbi:NPP1-domain-containing protein [Gonapodya prolifera JEL478]|uniref:NPP1-domain-containing protein n=1 Tax=Gonapodya prolifera (strain JEL478) TaxID=1344416 RepID=A0A139APW5_GONPJ|nr:NPP1-domain-containing protein [Gonapodya prolifera JEL478]|eukprot:KXS18789.1 NPP1-domain-containing protein [Gonapodya prolifera JEL478]